MPRLNNGLEIFKGLTKVEAFSIVAGGGDTTVADPIAIGDADADVAAITNFTALDPVFIIGDGGVELNKIGTPATTMPFGYKVAVAQGAGARVVEVVARDLGHVEENGVQYGASLQLSPVDAATSATPLAYIRGAGELNAKLSLRGFNNLNWQLIHGANEGESGAGSAADPYQIAIGSQELGAHGILCLRMTGYRFDLSIVTQDYLNCTVEVAVNSALGGRTPAVLPLGVKFERMVQRIWSV
jgi:hypothetical protein